VCSLRPMTRDRYAKCPTSNIYIHILRILKDDAYKSNSKKSPKACESCHDLLKPDLGETIRGGKVKHKRLVGF